MTRDARQQLPRGVVHNAGQDARSGEYSFVHNSADVGGEGVVNMWGGWRRIIKCGNTSQQDNEREGLALATVLP